MLISTDKDINASKSHFSKYKLYCWKLIESAYQLQTIKFTKKIYFNNSTNSCIKVDVIIKKHEHINIHMKYLYRYNIKNLKNPIYKDTFNKY